MVGDLSLPASSSMTPFLIMTARPGLELAFWVYGHRRPDLLALALKIELAVDYQVAKLDGGDRCLAVLKTDRWRMASGAN